MKKFKILTLTAIISSFVLIFTACGKSSKGSDKSDNRADKSVTVEITDVHGTVVGL